MLDQGILEQLKGVFAQIESTIELVYRESTHADQAQLFEMLQSLSSTSDKISLRAQASPAGKDLAPYFEIYTQNKFTGIAFEGIPGGHEFTSLILAILNSDRKGKFPDQLLQNRIQKLKGPIEIKTFISLSCENCPDVVQMMNLMAIIHGNFKHTMIDGQYAQAEIESLGIQGVPSIIYKGKLLHSGKVQLLDLLQKLESVIGTAESAASENVAPVDLGKFDVVVLGGGPAGASAAIYSVRKGLKTALIADKMGGQVQDTKGIENLISVTYTEGPILANQLNQHLAAYPVQIFEHRRVEQISTNEAEKIKNIRLNTGETLSTQSVIIATGAKWKELGIPGEKEYLGRGVAFCPHCDGPFYKGKKVAVIGGGNSGVEAAIDLAGIVREVVLFEFQDQLKADDVLVKKLYSLNNVTVITGAKTSQILGDGQKVQTLEYVERKTDQLKSVSLDGIFVQIGLAPNSQFVKDYVNMNRFGEIEVDLKGRTSVNGIYAAGDVTTAPYKQIIIAMGDGAKVALTAFEDRMVGKI
jgi:alkyl hydroperoxide reductase subunit F